MFSFFQHFEPEIVLVQFLYQELNWIFFVKNCSLFWPRCYHKECIIPSFLKILLEWCEQVFEYLLS